MFYKNICKLTLHIDDDHLCNFYMKYMQEEIGIRKWTNQTNLLTKREQ